MWLIFDCLTRASVPFSVRANFRRSASISFAVWFGTLTGLEGEGSGKDSTDSALLKKSGEEEGRVDYLPSVEGRVEDVVVVFEPTRECE